MFTESDLKHYLYKNFELPQSAIDYIANCYYNGPSRMVGTHAKTNIVSWVPSKKLNGKSFSTESRGPERALNTISQLDNSVLWHADQPEPIKIEITNKNGKKQKRSYTPDALSLTKNGPVVIEAKSQNEVDDLLIERSEDWKQIKGEVVFLPANRAFSKLGLRHEVYVYKSEDRYHIANLEQILWVNDTIGDINHYETSIAKELNASFCLSLEDLKRRLKLDNYTPLIYAIGKGWIVTDLKNQLITDAENCLVSSSHELLEEGLKLKESQRIYFPELIDPISLSLVPEKKSAEDALHRLKEVDSGKSNRNTRRWRKRIEEGKQQGLTSFQSLISLHHKCGNRSNQVNSKVKEFLNNYLSKTHIGRNGISIYRGYIEYRLFAREAHPEFDAVSRRTFTRYLDSISPEIRGRAKGGKRLGHAMALPSDPEERNLKAQAAWQCASIDHALVDLYLILYNKKEEIFVEKPWLTTMIDQHTGKILSFSFSFKKPSRHSIAKVLRACVRTHKKLPREIITDRGSDFKSVYFASLLAHYSVTLSLRASGHCRAGSEVERFFGEFRSQWLSQRDGNTVDFKNTRAIDGNKSPTNTAVLSPADFHRELSEFCNWRENICRGTGCYSIEALFENSHIELPHIARPVEYDNEFIVSTCIESEEYTFNMQRGVNYKNIWYSSPLMHLLLGKPRKNEVRLDPENPNLVFVRINDKWIPFYSSTINSYSAKTCSHQLAEGLIKHEASSRRRRVREEDDVLLADIKRRMDKARSDNGLTHLLEVNIDEDNSSEEVLQFSDLKQAQLRPLNKQSWSE